MSRYVKARQFSYSVIQLFLTYIDCCLNQITFFLKKKPQPSLSIIYCQIYTDCIHSMTFLLNIKKIDIYFCSKNSQAVQYFLWLHIINYDYVHLMSVAISRHHNWIGIYLNIIPYSINYKWCKVNEIFPLLPVIFCFLTNAETLKLMYDCMVNIYSIVQR